MYIEKNNETDFINRMSTLCKMKSFEESFASKNIYKLPRKKVIYKDRTDMYFGESIITTNNIKIRLRTIKFEYENFE